MFDFSFGELAVISAVALVVLGPERLPKVARTVGEWAVRKRATPISQVENDDSPRKACGAFQTCSSVSDTTSSATDSFWKRCSRKA